MQNTVIFFHNHWWHTICSQADSWHCGTSSLRLCPVLWLGRWKYQLLLSYPSLAPTPQAPWWRSKCHQLRGWKLPVASRDICYVPAFINCNRKGNKWLYFALQLAVQVGRKVRNPVCNCISCQADICKAWLFSGHTISAAFIMHVFSNSPSLNGFEASAISLAMRYLAFTAASQIFLTMSKHRLLFFQTRQQFIPLIYSLLSLQVVFFGMKSLIVTTEVIFFQHCNMLWTRQTHRIPIHFHE